MTKVEKIAVAFILVSISLVIANQAQLASSQSYNLCEAYSGQKVSRSDFKALLEAMNGGRCAEAWNVQPTFSLTQERVKQLAKDIGISAQGDSLAFFRQGEPSTMGIGALLVYGRQEQRFVIEEGDRLHLWRGGQPKRDLVLELSVRGCNPHDDVCDRLCSYERGVFDPECYRHEKEEGILCDLDAVDQNTKDGEISAEDLDGICDLDCYNNRTNMRRAYDPDCIPVDHKDSIIEPDSLGHKDGRCDPDAAESNFKCDPDCNGTTYEGNPLGLNDSDCYVCDKECNGYCSPACEDLDYPQVDPDCVRREHEDEWCERDDICDSGRGENCANSSDCPTGNSNCTDLDKVCCPSASDAGRFGCSQKKNVTKGKKCSCDNQCDSGLNCNPATSSASVDSACCPSLKRWNGTDCELQTDVLIVALKSNLKEVYSDQQISKMEDQVVEYSNSLQDIGGMLVYLDGSATAQAIGSKVNDPDDWQEIDAVLDQLIPRLDSKYLLILGGYERFHQAEHSLHGCPDPYYSSFQSDDDYGDYQPKDTMPEIPVGRIPDPNNGDMSVILESLKTYADLHQSGGLDLSQYGSVLMTQLQGQRATTGYCYFKAVFNQDCGLSSRCHFASGAQPSMLSGNTFTTLLVHGSRTAPQRFMRGHGSGFTMNSHEVPSLDVDNALWLMMPCYSSYLRNKDSTSQSIPMQFLRSGGAVYVGGTLTQAGWVGSGCPDTGDYHIGALYTLVANNFEVGKRIGQAYLEGKKDYRTLNDPHGCNYRQAHENLIYGDPTLKIERMW